MSMNGSIPRGCRARSGFTLTEVMIALMILVIVLVGGILSLTLYRRLAEAGNRQVEAIHTARTVLENLTEHDFYHAELNVGTHALPNGGFYTISRIPPTDPHSRLKLVVVTIPWMGGFPGTGMAANEVLTTVISEALHP